MRPLLYVVGVPGSGKSTAVSLALQSVSRESRGTTSLPYLEYEGGLVQLGNDDGVFRGTDFLHLAVLPEVEEWLRETDCPALICEGDRLANRRFFEAALGAGFALTLCWIDTPAEVAQARRHLRPAIAGRDRPAGTDLSETFIRGRETKIRGLAETYKRALWKVDGRRKPEQIAERLRAHPAIRDYARRDV